MPFLLNPFGFASSPSFVGPFDGLDTTNLIAAYCPGHRLFSATDPNTVKIRRVSDSVDQDFKSTNGPLDASEVSAFLGGSDGIVQNIFTQFGSIDMTPFIAGPRIFTGGALVALGSGIAPDYGYAGSSTFLINGSSFTLPQPFVLMSAIVADSIASGKGWMAKGATPQFHAGFNGTNFVMNAGSTLTGDVAATGTKYVVTNTFNSTSSRIRVNGVNGTPGNAGTNSTTTSLRLGVGVPGFMDGRIGISLVFNADISDAVIATYEAAIASIFGSFP